MASLAQSDTYGQIKRIFSQGTKGCMDNRNIPCSFWHRLLQAWPNQRLFSRPKMEQSKEFFFKARKDVQCPVKLEQFMLFLRTQRAGQCHVRLKSKRRFNKKWTNQKSFLSDTKSWTMPSKVRVACAPFGIAVASLA